MLKRMIYGCLLLNIIMFTSCNNNNNDDLVTKDSLQNSNAFFKQVTFDTTKESVVKSVVSVSAKVQPNEDKWIKVYPVVGGYIKNLYAHLGDFVHKGQILAVIQSSEIADFQNQYAAAKATLVNAKKTLSTNQDLLKAGLNTEQDVLQAEADLSKAKADYQRVEELNKLYGSYGNSAMNITSPLSGFIVDKIVYEGMKFRIDDPDFTSFFTIADISDVWVIGNVFETDVDKIKIGDSADIHLISYPDRHYKGIINRIYTALDPVTRVMKVRIDVPNPDFALKPEMFATVDIYYSNKQKKYPYIPSADIIFDRNKNYVMVKQGNNYVPIEIKINQTVGPITYLDAGLKPGDKVVNKFQLLLFNQYKEE